MSDTTSTAPKTPIEQLRAIVQNRANDNFIWFLQGEQKTLTALVDAIESDLAKALGAKSDILDTLLGEVQRGLALDKENANLHGQVMDLEMALDAKNDELDQVRDNATEAERTIGALTKIDPLMLVKAAESVRGNYVSEVTKAAEQAGIPVDEFREEVEARDPLVQEMLEGTRQIMELSVAIERANDGVKAR
jgi:hypothetical protein